MPPGTLTVNSRGLTRISVPRNRRAISGAFVTDGRDAGPRAEFEDNKLGAANSVQPVSIVIVLVVRAVAEPGRVTEHQHIWPGVAPAPDAARQLARRPHRRGIYFHRCPISGPGPFPARLGALAIMDSAMTFHHLLLGKSGTQEMPVDIARKHETARLGELSQDLIPGMRRGIAVQDPPMLVEPPEEGGSLSSVSGQADLGNSIPSFAYGG